MGIQLVCQAIMKDTGSEKRPAKRVNTLDAVNTEVELTSGYGGRFRHERSLALQRVYVEVHWVSSRASLTKGFEGR